MFRGAYTLTDENVKCSALTRANGGTPIFEVNIERCPENHLEIRKHALPCFIAIQTKGGQ